MQAMPNYQAMLTAWNIHPENWSNTSNFGMAVHSTPVGESVTGDTMSKGTEYELFLRPTDNWNIAINASKTHAVRENLAGTLSTWLEQRWANYLVYDANGRGTGALRWFGGGNGSITSSLGAARFGRNGWKWYECYRSLEGNDVPELRPWMFNIVTNYSFRNINALKGAFVGAGYRWQDKDVIGYGVKEVTARLSSVNPAIGVFDVTKPFYGDSIDAIDLWVGFSRKIYGNVEWRIQLNLRDAFHGARLIPIASNPDGSVAYSRIDQGRTWALTNNFKF
jgi:hypothetical protein